MQGRLDFDGESNMSTTVPQTGTALPPLPSLDGIDRLSFDTETTVEEDFFTRSLVGISYRLPDGRKSYIPMRHPGGGNYDEANVKEWVKHEVRGKQLVVANAKHEVHTMRRWGADLEELGCGLQDVFHQAALVNDNRRTTMLCADCGHTYYATGEGCDKCGSDNTNSLGQLNLDIIAREELNHQMIDADHSQLWEMTAAQVAPIATEDADVTWLLNEKYMPRIIAEELETVLALENELVFATCEMERNGAYLDVPKMLAWRSEVKSEWEKRVIAIYLETGLNVNPGKWTDMEKLFIKLGLKPGVNYMLTPGGQPVLAEEALIEMNHPVVTLALEARQLASLDSKYLGPYIEAINPDGLLRYSLHQLRGEKGTITGRYSSSSVNIQQVSKNKKQPLLLQRWPIRQLFIAGPGEEEWLSADASQIEYRFFAHYAEKLGMPRLAEAYRRDPKTDFHNVVVEWTGLIRDYAKNVNFAKLYGGGIGKIALMCKISESEGRKLVNKYDDTFPEAKRLIKMASDQAEVHGYVRTILGRRRRFPGKRERFYAALNAVFQGGAADVMKRKLIELYNMRKALGLTLRFTVHDEADGGLKDKSTLPQLQALLNSQTTTQLTVPILWEVSHGPNWHDLKKVT